MPVEAMRATGEVRIIVKASLYRQYREVQTYSAGLFFTEYDTTTIPKIMNTFVVQIARCAKKASSKLITTCLLFLAFAFIEEYPGLKTTAKLHLQRFIDEPEARTKKNYESLGELGY